MKASVQLNQAYAECMDALTHDDNRAVQRSSAYNYNTDTSNITLRNDRTSCYNRTKIYTEEEQKKLVEECMFVYEEEPIVRNIIDLMSDFGSQGVRIICSDPKQEKFGQEWFRFINGPDRCERFLNLLYRAGTVIAKRTDGKVPLKVQKKWRTYSNVDNGPKTEVVEIKEINNGKAVIPLKWTFYDPRQVEMIGGILSNFVGKPIFALRINEQLRNELYQLYKITDNKNELSQFKELIPKYVWDAIDQRSQFFPLDQSKTTAYYYKKDDWDLWGKPLVRPILKDIVTLNKLKQCDNAALDGAMSAVRLWNLGSVKEGIVPQKAALDKVRSILANAPKGGVIDVVWDDTLKFTESNSNLHNWLGSEKYTSTLVSIYAGLGVPPGLTGSSGSSSFTNNNISLKTLIERLKYGRTVLISFLNEQLALIQKAMGYTKSFEIAFDQMVLSDEAAEKALLLQLWDRNIISSEAVRFAFDLDHNEIEQMKVNREFRKQGKSSPPKASPYHNPEKDHDLKKLAVQKGGVTPSQIGLDLPDKKEGEKTFFESSTPQDKQYKPKGTPLTGRPKNSKDKIKRKQRRVLPRGASAKYSDLFKYAESAQSKIEEIINPIFIAIANKKNVRSLSTDETERLEYLKFRIFSNIEPYSDIDENKITEIASSNLAVDDEFYTTYTKNVYNTIDKYGRELTVHEKRNIYCESFAELFSAEEVDNPT
jgi:hypothetical protein